MQERLAQARLARGEHDLVAADLAELVARHPLREGLRALHLRALYAAGRQSEALESYAELRERLAEELGLDPGPELAALHRQILEQDAGLSAPPKAAIIRNSLPAPLDELIGRDEALAELRPLIPRHGWSRWSGRAGSARPGSPPSGPADVHPDGVHWSSWPRFRRRHAASPSRCSARSAPTRPPARPCPPADRLVAALRHRQLLLVLDNCEHVIEPVAELVARLLRDAPGVSVLATSREPLGLTGELLWEVPPLPCPTTVTSTRSGGRRRPGCSPRAPPRSSAGSGSTSRPRRRWRSSAAGWTACRWRWSWPRPGSARSASRASWIASTTGSGCSPPRQRDVPARQRTLTAVIGWSWDLLDEPTGWCSPGSRCSATAARPEAAEQVCRRRPGRRWPGWWTGRSWWLDDPGGPRYRLLESVAAFCLRHASPTPTRSAARHAAYYTGLAERADPGLRGPDQQEWLALLDAELANLRAALTHGGGLRLARRADLVLVPARPAHRGARRRWPLPGDPEDERRAAPWRLGLALLQGERIHRRRTRRACADPDGRAAWFVANAVIDRGDLALAPELLPEAFHRPVDRGGGAGLPGDARARGR